MDKSNNPKKIYGYTEEIKVFFESLKDERDGITQQSLEKVTKPFVEKIIDIPESIMSREDVYYVNYGD